MNNNITKTEIEKLYKKLDKETEQSGYHLNPDEEFTKELIKSLIINQKRYGYQACPCRLAEGKKQQDLDIICPCDYRDPDLNQYGTCYCALYVSEEIKKEKKQPHPIPERRPLKEEREKKQKTKQKITKKLDYPIWRCKVCGYLCAREQPPNICPICKAKKERFEKYIT